MLSMISFQSVKSPMAMHMKVPHPAKLLAVPRRFFSEKGPKNCNQTSLIGQKTPTQKRQEAEQEFYARIRLVCALFVVGTIATLWQQHQTAALVEKWRENIRTMQHVFSKGE